jgi:hypothetical protein
LKHEALLFHELLQIRWLGLEGQHQIEAHAKARRGGFLTVRLVWVAEL